MKCSLAITNFLEEIYSLSHSVVFPCFFELIAQEVFLISPCYPFKLCLQMLIFCFYPLLFSSLLFAAIYKASLDSHFDFFAFLFLGDGLDSCSCTMP